MSQAKSIDFLFNQMRAGAAGSLAGGSITFYYAGTTALKPVYFDTNKTLLAANPYTLSADGTASLFGDGLYYIVIKDSTGVIIYTYDDVELYSRGSIVSPTGSILLVTATSSPIQLTLPIVDDIMVVRTDLSATPIEILPPTGYSFVNSDPVYLYNQWESVVFKSSGTVYYIYRGLDIIPFVPVVYAPYVAASAYEIQFDCTSGNQTATWPAGTIEVIAFKKDTTANTATLIPPAGTTIGTESNYTIALQWETVFLRYDGVSNYYVVQ